MTLVVVTGCNDCPFFAGEVDTISGHKDFCTHPRSAGRLEKKQDATTPPPGCPLRQESIKVYLKPA